MISVSIFLFPTVLRGIPRRYFIADKADRGTAGTGASETEITIQFKVFARKMNSAEETPIIKHNYKLERYLASLKACEDRLILRMGYHWFDGLEVLYAERERARMAAMVETKKEFFYATLNVLPKELVNIVSSFLGRFKKMDKRNAHHKNFAPLWWDKKAEAACRKELHRQDKKAQKGRKTRSYKKRKVSEMVDLTQD